MTADIKQMTIDELEQEIKNLEESYAEAFRDDTDTEILDDVWRRIKEIKSELERRNNP